MSSSTTDSSTVLDVTMPQMGVSVAEGTVVSWAVEVGSVVSVDQTICEITTDKIDTEVPAPADGVVAEILVAVEETVSVGTVLARIVVGGGSGLGQAGLRAGPVAGAVSPAQAPGESRPRATRPIGVPDSARAVYSPVVQRIAAEHGVDLGQVKGTGRDARVRKQDVLAWVEQQALEPPLHTESPYRPEPADADRAGGVGIAVTRRLPPVTRSRRQDPPAATPDPNAPGSLSRIRKTIGEHMKRSLETAATCTTWMEADMARIEAARRELGLTALPLVARCVVEALAEHPELNATLDGAAYTLHAEVNLGIAVSLGDEGLIVPVVHGAQELGVEELGARIRDLAARARAGTLTPDEVRGGTFTITNPGQFGSLMATPVINQPQVAILDLEAIVKRPVVVTGDDGSDVIAIRPQTILGLSWDHRALDGVLAARFLGSVRRRLEGWDGG